MVNVHVDNSVMRFNQSKVGRDNDEWHDVAVPGLDNPDPEPLALEDADDYEPDLAEHTEAYLGGASSLAFSNWQMWYCRIAQQQHWA